MRGKGKKPALSSVERQRRYRIDRKLSSIQLSGSTLELLQEAKVLSGETIDNTVAAALGLFLKSEQAGADNTAQYSGQSPEQPLSQHRGAGKAVPGSGKKNVFRPIQVPADISISDAMSVGAISSPAYELLTSAGPILKPAESKKKRKNRERSALNKYQDDLPGL